MEFVTFHDTLSQNICFLVAFYSLKSKARVLATDGHEYSSDHYVQNEKKTSELLPLSSIKTE